MAELADALDSGSSGHYARAGSSPVIRSNAERAISKDIALFCLAAVEAKEKQMAVQVYFCEIFLYNKSVMMKEQ